MMASVNLTMDGETVSAAKVVIYGVAPIPWRSDGGRAGDHGQAGDAGDGRGRRRGRRRGGASLCR